MLDQVLKQNRETLLSLKCTQFWLISKLKTQSSRFIFTFHLFVYVLSATTERHRLPQKFHAIVRSAVSDKPLPVFSQKNVFFLRYRIWSNFNHDDWLYSTRNVWFSSSSYHRRCGRWHALITAKQWSTITIPLVYRQMLFTWKSVQI